MVIFALQSEKPLNYSFIVKILTLIVLVGGGMLLSHVLITGVAHIYGLHIETEKDLMALLTAPEHSVLIKCIIGINHVLIFIVCPMLFVYLFYRKSIGRYFVFRHFNAQYILLFPLALFSIYPLMAFLAFYVDQLDLPSFLDKMDQDSLSALSQLLKMDGPADLFLNLLIVGILPGIGEELLFRGVIQKELYQRWQNPHLAIVVTAIIFSAFHFQVTGFIPKMIIGLVLGYAYYFSRNLMLAMFIHILNNSTATISLYLAGGRIDPETIPAENVPISGVLLSTLVFGWLMYYIQSLSHQNSFTHE